MTNKNKFKILLVSISLLIMMGGALVANAAEEHNIKIMERVMVVGNADKIKDITGSAQFIGKDELDKHSYNDINRVLRQVPGVNLQEEEGYGNRPNIGIRGGRSERSADVTLMEDGILIAPAPYAAPAAYYFPRVARMESVEVMKGASTVRFGPRTTSGAVNLISSSIPSKGEGDALFAYGEDNTQRAQLNYGATSGRFGYVIDIGHEESDGFKSIDKVGGDTGFSIQDIMGKFRITSDPLADIFQSIEFKVGATEENSDETYLGLTQADFDVNPFRRYAASQKDNLDADHQQYQIQHYIEPMEGLDITTTLYQNNFARNWYKLQSATIGGSKKSISSALDDAAYLATLKGNTDLDGSAANNLTIRANNRKYYSRGIQSKIGKQFDYKGLDNQLEFGVRYHMDKEDRFQNEDRYSIINGVMTLTNAGAPGSNANREGSAKATALHVRDEITFGKWNIVPGIRYEHIELTRDNKASGQLDKNTLDVVIPGIGLGYQISDNTNIFGGVHKGFAPPGPSTNTSQKPEESINYEAGVRYNQNSLKTEFVAFYSDYSNLLGEETLSSGGAGEGDQFNGGEIDVYGLEVSAEYNLADLLKSSNYEYPLRFNYTFTDAEFGSSFNSSFSEWGNVIKGDELPYIARHQFFVSAGIEADKWMVNVGGKYMDEMRTKAGSGSIPVGQGTDAHFVVDLAGEYEVYKRTRLFVTVDNITDAEYVAARRPAGARPGKPRTVLAGLKIKF